MCQIMPCEFSGDTEIKSVINYYNTFFIRISVYASLLQAFSCYSNRHFINEQSHKNKQSQFYLSFTEVKTIPAL